MTKERRLAIAMWEQIKQELANDPEVNVVMLKDRFCVLHELHWSFDCWFCQYTPNCDVCPLNGCKEYHISYNKRNPLKRRLSACDNIINALKGKHNAQEQKNETNMQ